jgi:hypothetical protein
MTGEVEADETFIGQKARNMHKNVRARKITRTDGKDKTMVMGILERGKNGKPRQIRTNVVANRRKKPLQGEICEHVRVQEFLKSREEDAERHVRQRRAVPFVSVSG